MPLKDYTTKINAAKTASEVQTILAKAGARAVAVEYDDHGEPTALAFTARTPFGMREFTVPTDWQAVQAVLRKQKVQPSYLTEEHARRVAWRITKDWVEAQLAIIETEMVTIDQVMLPYMKTDHPTDARQVTMFEAYQESQRLMIESGRGLE
jgi:hypothetical protein